MTADTKHTYVLTILSLLSEPYQNKTLLQIHNAKVELLSFSPELLLHLSYNKNGVSGYFAFHKSKLRIICIKLLRNSVFEDAFHHFHSCSNNLIPLSDPHSIGSPFPS